ncbi:unnamed protein product, partial [Heterosigma akashiwo]
MGHADDKIENEENKEDPEKLSVPAGMDLPHVSAEAKQLLAYIGRYVPKDIELEAHLKPFVPEYIPAVNGPPLEV